MSPRQSALRERQAIPESHRKEIPDPDVMGITAWAGAIWTGKPRSQVNTDETDPEGVYVYQEEEAEAREYNGGELITAPDGYIRFSPVQEMVIPKEYYPRLIRRGILLVCLGVVAVIAFALLLRMNIVRF